MSIIPEPRTYLEGGGIAFRESKSALAFFGIQISNTGGPLGGYCIILLVAGSITLLYNFYSSENHSKKKN